MIHRDQFYQIAQFSMIKSRHHDDIRLVVKIVSRLISPNLRSSRVDAQLFSEYRPVFSIRALRVNYLIYKFIVILFL